MTGTSAAGAAAARANRPPPSLHEGGSNHADPVGIGRGAPHSTSTAGTMKRLLPACAALLFTACGSGSTPDAGPEVVRSEVGDTTVVRTEAGSVWGDTARFEPLLTIGELEGAPEYTFGRLVSIAVGPDDRIYAFDRQAAAVRVYDASGTHLESWGRSGQGPGELQSPDAGLAVLPDGRIVVRDRGNARLQLYSPSGDAAGSWPVITGQYINRRAFGTVGDTLVNPDVVNPADPLPEWRLGLVRIGPDGTVLDTLAIPVEGPTVPQLVARNGGNMSEAEVPFAPGPHWAWHPDGYVVHGNGDAYRIHLDRPGGPLRIERNVEALPVSREERAQEELRVTNGMRWLDPTWRWTSPGIPDRKPFFRGLEVGLDGRLWVLRHGPTYEMDDPDYDADDPFDTEIRLHQEVVADAFDGSGVFLGPAVLPRGIDARVPPVFRGDRMWAVIRDDLGVQRIGVFEARRPDVGGD